LARTVRAIIAFGFIILPFFFTWLKLSHLSIAEILQAISNASAIDYIWKGALIIYFFSWVWGCKFDVNLQEVVYIRVANAGVLPLRAFAIAGVIIAMGGVLLWVNTYPAFVVTLTVFTLIDHLAWRYLVGFLGPPIQTSRKYYENKLDYVELERLNIVVDEVAGSWKWWRNIMGLALIVAMLGLVYYEPKMDTVSIGGLQVSWQLLQALSILVWVVAMEAWIWYIRIRARISLNILQNLRSKYEFKAKVMPTV